MTVGRTQQPTQVGRTTAQATDGETTAAPPQSAPGAATGPTVATARTAPTGPNAAIAAARPVDALEGQSGVRMEADAPRKMAQWDRSWTNPPRARDQAARDVENAATINEVQRHFAPESGELQRGQHAKGLYATTRAELRVADNLPPELSFGPFKPGAVLRTAVRFSNAASATESDQEAGRQGLALKITDDKGRTQDILTTTGAAEFLAEDGPSALAAARAEMKGPLGVLGLAADIGPIDAFKLVYAAKTTATEGKSVAGQVFHSRVPFQLGDYAVKFRLVPVTGLDEPFQADGPNARTEDVQKRLENGPITYKLQVQGKPSDVSLDDAREKWAGTSYVTIGEVVIPPEPRNDAALRRDQEGINKLSFSPFNRWDSEDDRALKPLGNVNETRRKVYEASAAARGSGGPESKKCPFGFGASAKGDAVET